MNPSRSILSYLAFWLIGLFYFVLFFQAKEWKSKNVMRYDLGCYYAYLPAIFIDHDITLSSTPTFHKQIYEWAYKAPGRYDRVLKMTMGVAYFHLPFFLLAHITAPLLGHPMDGVNPHYYFFIMLGSLFYCLVGFWILRKLLLRYFNDFVSAITLLIIATSTNLLYYTVYQGPMSQCYNFMLITLLLYLTVLVHENPGWKNITLTGAVIGMITVIRPTNLLVVLIPLLYGVTSRNDLQAKWVLMKRMAMPLLLGTLAALLFILPQLLYWKYVSGHLLYYSYRYEHFYFFNPHIIDGLFSYRKGWLIYTPVMVFTLAGIPLIRKYAGKWQLPVYVLVPLFIWTIYSWWIWWYGGSFGSRPMIDIYGLLAIPLASFISLAFRKKWLVGCFLLLFGFFAWLNFFQTWQFRAARIHYDSMTKEAYWKVFLSRQYPADLTLYLKHPDEEKAMKGEDE